MAAAKIHAEKYNALGKTLRTGEIQITIIDGRVHLQFDIHNWVMFEEDFFAAIAKAQIQPGV